MPLTGLVLTGGGARAAYQVGVLKGVQEISGQEFSPFNVLVGASAGAINAAFLAERGRIPFPGLVDDMSQLWREIRTDQVIRGDFRTFGRMVGRWVRDLSFAGRFSQKRATYLLNTNPLQGFLSRNLDFKRMHSNLRHGQVHGLAISATNYLTGSNMVFFDGSSSIHPWLRHGRVAHRTRIQVKHILASAAIPIFFKPVKIRGAYYGDGSVRLTAPLSPAIHMGAEKILAVSVQHRRSDSLTVAMNRQGIMTDISLIDIAGVMLNAVFLDALELDAERMQRINDTAKILTQEGRPHPFHLRNIPLLVVRPSQDLGTLASEQFDRFPRSLRYLLKGLGASREKGWDLLSYLAFNEAYTQPLIQLGYTDVLARREEIQRFLAE